MHASYVFCMCAKVDAYILICRKFFETLGQHLPLHQANTPIQKLPNGLFLNFPCRIHSHNFWSGVCESMGRCSWKRTPSGSNFFHFHAVFGKNCSKVGVPWLWLMVPWEILDPAQWEKQMYLLDFTSEARQHIGVLAFLIKWPHLVACTLSFSSCKITYIFWMWKVILASNKMLRVNCFHKFNTKFRKWYSSTDSTMIMRQILAHYWPSRSGRVVYNALLAACGTDGRGFKPWPEPSSMLVDMSF